MKKIISLLLSLILIFTMTCPMLLIFADDEEEIETVIIDDDTYINYKVVDPSADVDGDEYISITGMKYDKVFSNYEELQAAGGYQYNNYISIFDGKKVIIADTIDGYPVKKVSGTIQFRSKEIYLPETITNLCEDAINMRNTTKVSIPLAAKYSQVIFADVNMDDVTIVYTQGEGEPWRYSDHGHKDYGNGRGSIVTPSYSFKRYNGELTGCVNFTPCTGWAVDDYNTNDLPPAMYRHCINLGCVWWQNFPSFKHLEFAEGVTYIPKGLCAHAIWLEDIKFPSTLIQIGYSIVNPANGGSNLSVGLGNSGYVSGMSYETGGYYPIGAFCCCPKLKSVRFPASLKYIYAYVFEDCDIEEYIFEGDKLEILGENSLCGDYRKCLVNFEDRSRLYNYIKDFNLSDFASSILYSDIPYINIVHCYSDYWAINNDVIIGPDQLKAPYLRDNSANKNLYDCPEYKAFEAHTATYAEIEANGGNPTYTASVDIKQEPKLHKVYISNRETEHNSVQKTNNYDPILGYSSYEVWNNSLGRWIKFSGQQQQTQIAQLNISEYYAKDMKNYHLCDFNYNGNGGNVIDEDNIDNKKFFQYEEINTNASATKNNSIFVGWSLSNSYNDILLNSDNRFYITEDSIASALYIPNGLQGTLSYNANGGTGTMPDQHYSYHDDNQIDLYDNCFTKKDATFLGWSLNPDATEPEFENMQENIQLDWDASNTYTLYAVWKNDELIEEPETDEGNYNDQDEPDDTLDQDDETDEEEDIDFDEEAVINVYYVDSKGNQLEEPDIIETSFDEEYSISAKDIENYKLVSGYRVVSGTVNDDIINITFIYALKDSVITVNYLDENNIPVAQCDEYHLNYGDTYNIRPKQIQNYDLISDDKAITGTVEEDGITINFFYRIQSAKITVNYVNAENNPIAESETINTVMGAQYSVSPKEIKNYVLISTNGETGGIVKNRNIEITFVYALKDSVITINYIDEDNNPVSDPETVEIKYGDEYNITPKNIPNYDLISNGDAVTGVVKDDEIIINFIYRIQSAKITVNYVDAENNPIIESKIINTVVGAQYSVSPEEIKKYVLISTIGETNGTVIERNMEITFMYALKNSTITINYVDENNNPVSDQDVINVKYGDEYNIAPKNIPNYDLISNGDAITGVVEDDEIIINFIYRIQSAKIIVNYVDAENNALESQDIINTTIGAPYSVSPKELQNYKLISTIGEISGEIKQKITGITFVYALKDSKITVKYIDEDGNEISDPDIYPLKYTDPYNIAPKDIPNYEPKTNQSEITGTIKEPEVEITFIYSPKRGTVIARHLDEEGNRIANDVEQTVQYSHTYETEALEFFDYVLKERPENDHGIVDKELTTVVYVYAKKPCTINVSYVDANDKKILDDLEILKGYGDEYETSKKDIYGYYLTEMPENYKGVIKQNVINVKYIYNLKKSKLKIKYIDIDTKKVLKEDEKEEDVFTVYNITPEEIEGYDLVTDPDTLVGTFKETDTIIEIKYKPHLDPTPEPEPEPAPKPDPTTTSTPTSTVTPTKEKTPTTPKKTITAKVVKKVKTGIESHTTLSGSIFILSFFICLHLIAKRKIKKDN